MSSIGNVKHLCLPALALIALPLGSVCSRQPALVADRPAEAHRALCPKALAPTCRIILHKQQRLCADLRAQAGRTRSPAHQAELLRESNQAAEDYNRVARTSDPSVFQDASLPHTLPEKRESSDENPHSVQ